MRQKRRLLASLTYLVKFSMQENTKAHASIAIVASVSMCYGKYGIFNNQVVIISLLLSSGKRILKTNQSAYD